jgi:hypothetical protein
MILITTALMIEANPIRNALGLKAVANQPVPVFQNEEYLLVVTGTGAQKAAASTGWALGRFPGIEAAVNIGFAGAPESVSGLHQWHRIHAVRDVSTGRLHIPDILDKHPFAEASLLTVGQPVWQDPGKDCLVDMEGSGFFEAARVCLSPDLILLLKWVSDHLNPALDRKSTAEAFTTAIEQILPFLQELVIGTAQPESDRPELLDTVLRRLRLTQTQAQFMGKWICGYLARDGNPERVLNVLPDQPPAKKVDNTRLYEVLKDVLKG